MNAIALEESKPNGHKWGEIKKKNKGGDGAPNICIWEINDPAYYYGHVVRNNEQTVSYEYTGQFTDAVGIVPVQ